VIKVTKTVSVIAVIDNLIVTCGSDVSSVNLNDDKQILKTIVIQQATLVSLFAHKGSK